MAAKIDTEACRLNGDVAARIEITHCGPNGDIPTIIIHSYNDVSSL